MFINVRSNVDQFTKDLDRVAKKQMPYATSMAINEVAGLCKKEIQQQINRLDRPVSFTKNSTFLVKSNKSRKPITAIVGVKDKTASYLVYLEDGTAEQPKGKAIPVPTSFYKNAAGNIKRGRIKEDLRNSEVYFSGEPNGRAAGVFKRMGTKKKPKLRRLATWKGSVNHSKRLRLGPRVRIIVDRNFNKLLARQLLAAMA